MREINRIPEYRNAVEAAIICLDEGFPRDDIQAAPDRLRNITREAIDVYMAQQEANGLIEGVSWWQNANGYTAIALHDLWSGERKKYDILALSLRRCEETNDSGESFINDFNDDSLWWALCCLHVYNLGMDLWFLQQAETVWRHVSKSVCNRGQEFFGDVDMEGGVFWRSQPPHGDHLNAISTGLFAELSVRLALIEDTTALHSDVSAEDYIEACRRSLGWILRCRYLVAEGLVLDRLELDSQKAVDWKFTYNTAVVLGTCALLYEATREDEYVVLSCHMARRAMARRLWVDENGILTEPSAYGRGNHDPLIDTDGIEFKSVLIRQLGTLYDVLRRTNRRSIQPQKMAGEIKRFVNNHVRAQMHCNNDGKDHYGPWWAGK